MNNVKAATFGSTEVCIVAALSEMNIFEGRLEIRLFSSRAAISVALVQWAVKRPLGVF